jgi:hypothetical protein
VPAVVAVVVAAIARPAELQQESQRLSADERHLEGIESLGVSQTRGHRRWQRCVLVEVDAGDVVDVDAVAARL